MASKGVDKTAEVIGDELSSLMYIHDRATGEDHLMGGAAAAGEFMAHVEALGLNPDRLLC